MLPALFSAGCDGAGPPLSDAGIRADSESESSAGTAAATDPDDGSEMELQVSVALSSVIETVAVVTWSYGSKPVGEASVDFGRTGVDWEYTVPVDASDHTDGAYRTVLVGMKQNAEYRFRINADGETGDEHTVTTGYVPVNIPPPIVERTDASAPVGGFVVTGTWTVIGGGMPIAYIMDADGDIVWTFGAEGVTDITAARLSYDGKNIWAVPANYSGEWGSIFRVSIDGLETEIFDVIGASHDIFPVAGETMAFIELSGDCCKVNEVSPRGEIVEVYDLRAAGYTQCNCNALRYSESEGLYTVSETTSGDYVAFDRSGSFAWAWRPEGHHHGCHLAGSSFLGFFNPDTVREYEVDGAELGAEIWHYRADNDTLFLGDVQRLPGGNTMVTFSDDAVIQEVDAQMRLIRSITFDDPIGFAAWRQSLYEPPPDVVL